VGVEKGLLGSAVGAVERSEGSFLSSGGLSSDTGIGCAGGARELPVTSAFLPFSVISTSRQGQILAQNQGLGCARELRT
jgi:hypothetical protein